jgi:RNA polymerase sigma-70 factor, ECF subfamily
MPTDPANLTPAELDRLVVRAQVGDHEAFVAVVEATEHDLRVLVSCYATSLAMVDEVMQGTYVTAFEKLSTYEARGTLKSWLGGIARNLVRRELDGRRRQQALDGEVLDQVLAQAAHGRIEREDDTVPERELATLRRCLDELAPEARRLVDERYVADKPVNEIARLLQRTSNWVAVSLFRIRKTLHLCLSRGGVTVPPTKGQP